MNDPAGTFEIDITKANNLIGQWANIAKGIARQCKWRAQGQCLTNCPGLAVCNLDGLTLVNPSGAGAVGAGVSPAHLKPDN